MVHAPSGGGGTGGGGKAGAGAASASVRDALRAGADERFGRWSFAATAAMLVLLPSAYSLLLNVAYLGPQHALRAATETVDLCVAFFAMWAPWLLTFRQAWVVASGSWCGCCGRAPRGGGGNRGAGAVGGGGGNGGGGGGGSGGRGGGGSGWLQHGLMSRYVAVGPVYLTPEYFIF